MGLEADAVAIASGNRQVHQEADALRLAGENPRQPLPVASHRTNGWCTVLFVIARSDGTWQTEVVPVLEGETRGTSGFASSALPSREAVPDGELLVLGEFRHTTETAQCHLAVVGVAAHDDVRLRVDGSR
jgi:hypothetical protein